MSEANKAKLAGKTTVREIFETATEFERVAYAFYKALIPNVSPNIRGLVEELAEEELEHVALFTKLAHDPDVASVLSAAIVHPASNGRFSACVRTPDLGLDPDDQAVLEYALMRESAAMDQYAELAETTPPGRLKDTFLFLANEETKHKAELEKIYQTLVHAGGV